MDSECRWSFKHHGAGIGIVLTTPGGSIIEQSFTFSFSASNNEAKYEAVLAGLRMATTLGVMGLEVRYDSLPVVNQVSGEYIARDTRMAEYLQLVLGLKSKISRCNFKWVVRSENNHANSLANLGAATKFQFRREIPVEHIANPSIQ